MYVDRAVRSVLCVDVGPYSTDRGGNGVVVCLSCEPTKEWTDDAHTKLSFHDIHGCLSQSHSTTTSHTIVIKEKRISG